MAFAAATIHLGSTRAVKLLTMEIFECIRIYSNYMLIHTYIYGSFINVVIRLLSTVIVGKICLFCLLLKKSTMILWRTVTFTMLPIDVFIRICSRIWSTDMSIVIIPRSSFDCNQLLVAGIPCFVAPYAFDSMMERCGGFAWIDVSGSADTNEKSRIECMSMNCLWLNQLPLRFRTRDHKSRLHTLQSSIDFSKQTDVSKKISWVLPSQTYLLRSIHSFTQFGIDNWCTLWISST